MPEKRTLGFRRHEAVAGADDGTVADSGPKPMDDAAAAALLPDRPIRGHKGTFGKVLAIAGSLDYAGAALLVCRAAGRAGAGLVTLAIPESLQPLFAAKVVEATTMALPEDDVEEVDPEPAIARILDHEHDAIVVGPGLRPGLATTDLVRMLLAVPDHDPSPAVPMVLDAEALRSMATMGEWWTGPMRPCVLTPHPGEFERLREGAGIEPADAGDLSADDAARRAAALAAAQAWGQVVVLKGAKTVIAEPDGTLTVAPFENPGLATGGTGDVLAGVIGGLLAQGLAPGPAARLGVYLHGTAGDLIAERFGDAGLLASDLPDAVPVVRKRLAAIAERTKSGKRLGFAVRDGDGAGA
jgi:NAD(P)H-hydrate epimerase